MRLVHFVCALVIIAGAVSASASEVCMSGKSELPVNNDQVLQWKATTGNQYHSRGHIQGTLKKIYAGTSSHNHMEVVIGPNDTDTIEVIYNDAFGAMPSTMHAGSTVEACGDYITSNVPTGRYPASPDGAILHWVHHSSNPHHESGFVIVDGVATGQDTAGAGPKPGGHGRKRKH